MTKQIKDIKKDIKKINDLKKACSAKLNKIFKNESIDVNERWELFKKTDECYFKQFPFIQHFDAEKTCKIYFYDDFGIGRNEIVDMVSIIEMMEEVLDVSKAEFSKSKFDRNFIDLLKNEVLEKGIRFFRNDW